MQGCPIKKLGGEPEVRAKAARAEETDRGSQRGPSVIAQHRPCSGGVGNNKASDARPAIGDGRTPRV